MKNTFFGQSDIIFFFRILREVSDPWWWTKGSQLLGTRLAWPRTRGWCACADIRSDADSGWCHINQNKKSDVSFPYIETSLLSYQIFQSLFEVFSRLVISQESYLCWVLHQHCRGLETSCTATSLTYCSCAVAAYNTARWRPKLWHCTPRIWYGTVVHSRNSKGRDMNFCTVNAIGLPWKWKIYVVKCDTDHIRHLCTHVKIDGIRTMSRGVRDWGRGRGEQQLRFNVILDVSLS